jgi:hypothetical protein
MGKERAYSASPNITSGDQCRASLPVLALLLGMGADESNGSRKAPGQVSCQQVYIETPRALSWN